MIIIKSIMDGFYGIVLLIHVLTGAIFVMTLVIMQIVVGPAMGKVPASEGKTAAQGVIQKRWVPVIDAAIIIQSVTALIILIERWDMIAASPLLHVKITFGIIALVLANLLHFYWRGKKQKLKREGKTEEFKKLNQLTMFLEKAALVFAVATFVLAVSFNHLF